MISSTMQTILHKSAHVLIVDDMPKNIQVLGTTLRQRDYQIYVAQNGLQALKILEEIHPDLILLDVMMPELDGFETCRRIKDNPATADIPVIFLTAKAESEDIVKGFELGAVDYITKPFKATELLARVHTHLELKASRDLIIKISNERKELLHILCHDLANSLGAVVSMLNISDHPEEFGEMKDYLRSTAQNGLNLINLVREMRALEEHRLRLHRVDIPDAVAKSLRVLQQRFEQKNIEVTRQIPSALWARAEEVSLVNSVLNNLLTNAVKFSYPDSMIVIEAREEADRVLIRIQDRGVGISPRIMENLFDMNKTTSRPGTNGERGTGFGMPLVKKFVETYGGKLEIVSRAEQDFPEDHGTTVTLYLLKA